MGKGIVIVIMTAALAAVMVIAVAGAASGGESWDTTEKSLFGTFLVAHAIDTLQTNYALRHPNDFTEKNPIYREADNIGMLYPLAIAIGYGVYRLADWLPHAHRKTVLAIFGSVKLLAVSNNYGVGVGMQF